MTFSSERQFVEQLLPHLLTWMSARSSRIAYAKREVGAGRGIADVVVSQPPRTKVVMPTEPLSANEAVLLAALRRLSGSTTIAALASECGIGAEKMKNVVLSRLQLQGLISLPTGDRVQLLSSFSLRTRISSIEAKLSRWKDILTDSTNEQSYLVVLSRSLPHCLDSRLRFRV
jgi:hypothetical protein